MIMMMGSQIVLMEAFDSAGIGIDNNHLLVRTNNCCAH